jgi:hypothetical protein
MARIMALVLPAPGRSLSTLKDGRPALRNPSNGPVPAAGRIFERKSRYFLLLQKISAKSNTQSWNSAHKMGYGNPIFFLFIINYNGYDSQFEALILLNYLAIAWILTDTVTANSIESNALYHKNHRYVRPSPFPGLEVYIPCGD